MGRIEAALFLTRTLGANPHAVSTDGATALHCACQEGHTELARILVRDFRLDANAVDNITWGGETPLHKASGVGHTGTALSLINDRGARVDAIDKDRNTPLMQAAAGGHTGTALALINIGGARIDASEQNSVTPLHCASSCGHPVTVSALLAEGARLDVKNADGDTPQQVICTHPEADPAAKPLLLAAFARHARLERLAREVLHHAAAPDHASLQRAIEALVAAAAEPWAGSAAVARPASALKYWMVLWMPEMTSVLGDQLSCWTARVMSGRRLRGSSCVAGV
jgi:ankyrin repeat protein